MYRKIRGGVLRQRCRLDRACSALAYSELDRQAHRCRVRRMYGVPYCMVWYMVRARWTALRRWGSQWGHAEHVCMVRQEKDGAVVHRPAASSQICGARGPPGSSVLAVGYSTTYCTAAMSCTRPWVIRAICASSAASAWQRGSAGLPQACLYLHYMLHPPCVHPVTLCPPFVHPSLCTYSSVLAAIGHILHGGAFC